MRFSLLYAIPCAPHQSPPQRYGNEFLARVAPMTYDQVADSIAAYDGLKRGVARRRAFQR